MSSLGGSWSSAGKLARRHVPMRLKAVSANRSAAIQVPIKAARIAEPWRPNRRLRNNARPAKRLRKSTMESRCAMRRSPVGDAVTGCEELNWRILYWFQRLGLRLALDAMGAGRGSTSCYCDQGALKEPRGTAHPLFGMSLCLQTLRTVRQPHPGLSGFGIPGADIWQRRLFSQFFRPRSLFSKKLDLQQRNDPLSPELPP